MQSSLKACKASLTFSAVIIILPAKWMSFKLDPVILLLHTVLFKGKYFDWWNQMCLHQRKCLLHWDGDCSPF